VTDNIPLADKAVNGPMLQCIRTDVGGHQSLLNAVAFVVARIWVLRIFGVVSEYASPHSS
jgi:hypothetical protein